MYATLVRTVTAAALTVTAFTATTPAATATTPGPTRIMIVGDSVTHGADGDYTWRYFAHRSLTASGANVDFVGNRSGTYVSPDNLWGGDYADPSFDTDHASRWGLMMWETFNAPSATATPIGELVTDYQPDVVIELLGVNDFVWRGLSVQTMLDQSRQFVTDARAANPDVDVILGALPQTWIVHATPYNAALPALAAELDTPTSRVIVAEPDPTFTQNVDTYDPAHPSTSGEIKIAHAMTTALADLGVGSPVRVTPPPAEPRRVRARTLARHRAVRVTWRPAHRADRYTVKCGGRVKITRRTRVTVRRVHPRVRVCKVLAVNTTGRSDWTRARIRRTR